VLVINIFNEKIFILLWFWYTLLLAMTLASFCYWFLVMSFPCFGRWYIATNLELGGTVELTKERKDIHRFVNEYLKQDGIFVLRMVSLHAGILFGNELVGNLYKIYLQVREQTPPIPKVTENHYVTNHDQYLRHRKKKDKKKTDANSDDVITALVPDVKSIKSSSSNDSDDSSDSERRKKREGGSEKSLGV